MPDISLMGATYSDVPAVVLPTANSGTARFDYTADADATAEDIASGKTAYVNGEKLVGTGGGSSITVEQLNVSAGGTYTAPTGKAYSPVVVPSGSTTPASSISATGATVSTSTNTLTLSKSSVSNTPQVSAGYITGGTAGNSSVSLSATVSINPTPTASGATVTIPSGYYSSQTTKSVASGTAGTPTATKGTVSNHAVSVTPSVTNSTGYITGSTKTGTAVTVSASELVSGSETKTENGTYDVTNLASLVVNVSGGGTSKNVQVVQNTSTRITSTSYTKACGTITVSKAGTYDIYWCAYRTSSSGTWGTQWYKNGTAQGTVQTSFTNSYYQAIHLTNITLAKNDTIDVYGRSRGNSYYLYVGQLLIIEV